MSRIDLYYDFTTLIFVGFVTVKPRQCTRQSITFLKNNFSIVTLLT
jgi:hypothetical protein